MKNKHKGLFSRVLVCYCIGFMTLLTIAAFIILGFTGYDATGILGVAAGVFGGELLLLCLKRIFANDKPDDGGNI